MAKQEQGYRREWCNQSIHFSCKVFCFDRAIEDHLLLKLGFWEAHEALLVQSTLSLDRTRMGKLQQEDPIWGLVSPAGTHPYFSACPFSPSVPLPSFLFFCLWSGEQGARDELPWFLPRETCCLWIIQQTNEYQAKRSLPNSPVDRSLDLYAFVWAFLMERKMQRKLTYWLPLGISGPNIFCFFLLFASSLLQAS